MTLSTRAPNPGEAVTTDFWGQPVASDSGRTEYYKDAPAGNRLVQPRFTANSNTIVKIAP